MTRVVGGIARGRRLAVPPGRGTRPTSDRAREGLFGTVQAVLGSLTGTRVLDLYAGSGAVGLEALSRGAAHALLVESAPAAIRVIRANIAALDLPGACLVNDRVERVLARGPARLPRPEAFAPGSAPGPSAGPGAPRRSVPGSAPDAAPGSQATAAPGSPPGPAAEPAPGSPPGPAAEPAPGSPLGSAAGHVGDAGEGYDFVFADPPYAVGDEEIAAILWALRQGGWLAEGALVAVERRTGDSRFGWPSGYVADRARRYGDTTLWYGLAASA
jgi:16S rRNA (guanine966-N2)-methyltransferase